MTIDELYAEIDELDLECASVPSDCNSNNDSDTNLQANVGNENEFLFETHDETVHLLSESSESEWEPEDLVPLAGLKLKIPKATLWKQCEYDVPSPEQFVSDCGVPQFIKNLDNHGAFDIFNLLMTDEIFNHFVFQTNLYAQQEHLKTGKAYVPTNILEIKAFIGANMLMSIKQCPSYRDHWSTSPDLHDPFISKLMPMHRFGWLLSNIHLNDNVVMPQRGDEQYDKLYKVRPVIDMLKANFQKSLNLHKTVAIDESMIKFKGRSTLKQYMPKKPIKRGYKVWVLADQTGYCWDFDIYTGRTGTDVEKNLGYRVVKRLTTQIRGKNHHLYFDNFFSSVDLMEFLLQQNIYACGTVNVTRRKLPTFSADKTLQRGEYEWWQSSNGLSAVKWRDKRCVHLLSNYHNPRETTQVKRKNKDGSLSELPCPVMVTDYNKNMNFVDKFDQIKATYCIDRKSHKWWHRILFFLIDTCVVNAYVIYTLLPENPKISMKEFRRSIIGHLVADVLTLKMNSLPQQLSVPIIQRKPCQPKSVRLSQSAHQPIRTSRRRCGFCSTKHNEVRTNWECSVCKIPLCLSKSKSCFQTYHLK